MIHLETIFWMIVFITVNTIQVIVIYGEEWTNFNYSLCQTKFNDSLGLF